MEGAANRLAGSPSQSSPRRAGAQPLATPIGTIPCGFRRHGNSLALAADVARDFPRTACSSAAVRATRLYDYSYVTTATRLAAEAKRLGGDAPAARLSNHTCPPKSTPAHPADRRGRQGGAKDLTGENTALGLDRLGINRWNLWIRSTGPARVGAIKNGASMKRRLVDRFRLRALTEHPGR